ncbi:oligogalacturonate lyase family protein [Thermoanaerobacterium thermosaccharolyticum]|uniref:oligogalacturonate lyase family protein n=1 Tax=Thermoanaerobacterium thermosaccharolyticum TaxID=1517 RepID=UPI003D286E2A
MSKGQIYKSELLKFKDDVTGVEVTKLTDNQGNTIHPYFTQPLLSSDGKYLLTASDRTGLWQLYSLELETGKMVELTDDSCVAPQSPCLDSNRMIAYYWNGLVLKSVDLSNLIEREIYKVPEGFHPGILSISADGEALDFVYIENLNLSTLTGKLYSGMSETLYRRPSCVVMRVKPYEGTAEAIWGEREWISHVITSPVDKDIIVFCHEGDWHLVQRTWVIKASTHEIWPIIETKRYLERAGHEFFTKKGTLVTQYGIRETTNSEWKCSDVFIKPDGSGMRKYDYYPGPKPMHIQVNSTETIGVGDCAYIDSDFKDARNFMILIKYEDNQAKQKLLCRHNTSWKYQYSHPHPIFTNDDRYVIFGSDRDGYNNIYMVPVQW